MIKGNIRIIDENIRTRYRGVVICLIGGMAAFWLSEHYQTPAMLLALLLGLALHFLHEDKRISCGVDWVAKELLRVGVALLGLRIAFGDIIAGGVHGPLLVIGAMIATFIFGAVFARALGLTSVFARLSAGSVAICGVSAAIAISAVLPKRKGGDEELALVIISVTTLSTLAMIVYPLVTTAFSFNDQMAGVFVGGAIHDVAQVIGAGYSISDEAGDTATYIKLMRVALLLPIVLILGAMSRKASSSEERPPIMPMFLVAFVCLATINSFGWTNETVNEVGGQISRALLVMSIFAIGVKSQLRDIFKVGPQPFLLVCVETVLMATVIIGGLLLTR